MNLLASVALAGAGCACSKLVGSDCRKDFGERFVTEFRWSDTPLTLTSVQVDNT
jgi:hypothetical protein